MSMSSSQLAASIRTSKRDAAHQRRLATDPTYAQRLEREQAAYAAFCERFGHPEHEVIQP